MSMVYLDFTNSITFFYTPYTKISCWLLPTNWCIINVGLCIWLARLKSDTGFRIDYNPFLRLNVSKMHKTNKITAAWIWCGFSLISVLIRHFVRGISMRIRCYSAAKPHKTNKYDKDMDMHRRKLIKRLK